MTSNRSNLARSKSVPPAKSDTHAIIVFDKQSSKRSQSIGSQSIGSQSFNDRYTEKYPYSITNKATTIPMKTLDETDEHHDPPLTSTKVSQSQQPINQNGKTVSRSSLKMMFKFQ